MPKRELDLDPLIKEFKRQQGKLPRVLGNSAVKFFRSNFDREGFLDRTTTKWKPRTYTARGGPKKTLQVTGALKRSIRVKSAVFGRIIIGTYGVPYAEIHNTGGVVRPRVTNRMRGFAWAQFKKTGNPMFKGIATTKKARLTVPIPKREYIGDSVTLEKALKKRIEKEIRIFTAKQA